MEDTRIPRSLCKVVGGSVRSFSMQVMRGLSFPIRRTLNFVVLKWRLQVFCQLSNSFKLL